MPRAVIEAWEVPLIKAMLRRGEYSDQEILAYFTRPTRSVNHRVIAEIRKEKKHATVSACSEDELAEFLVSWPEVDPQTGLSLRSDELLIKAREAMIAAVHTFNGAGLTFRAELFIVSAIIAWTYLMHAWFKRENVEYRYIDNDGNFAKTPGGADRFWELGRCIRAPQAPLSNGIKNNLEFILELRNEIEHRSTNRIDDSVSAKLQACCINFNDEIKSLFGPQHGLEKRLPIALQFVTFSSDQRALIKKASSLPAHIETMMDGFHSNLTHEQQSDPQFAMRVAFVQKLANKATNADLAIEFVKPTAEQAEALNNLFFKEVERPKYRASQVVAKLRQNGFPKFTVSRHTDL